MMLRHPLRGKLVVHDARNRDHRTRKRKDVRRRLPYAVVGAYENYRRVGRFEKKFDGLGISGGEVKVLTPVLLRHHTRNEKRFGDVPCKMAERLLCDSPRLLLVGRDTALNDVLYGNPAALRHERPETGRKTGPGIIGMSLDKVHSKRTVAARPCASRPSTAANDSIVAFVSARSARVNATKL